MLIILQYHLAAGELDSEKSGLIIYTWIGKNCAVPSFVRRRLAEGDALKQPTIPAQPGSSLKLPTGHFLNGQPLYARPYCRAVMLKHQLFTRQFLPRLKRHSKTPRTINIFDRQDKFVIHEKLTIL